MRKFNGNTFSSDVSNAPKSGATTVCGYEFKKENWCFRGDYRIGGPILSPRSSTSQRIPCIQTEIQQNRQVSPATRARVDPNPAQRHSIILQIDPFSGMSLWTWVDRNRICWHRPRSIQKVSLKLSASTRTHRNCFTPWAKEHFRKIGIARRKPSATTKRTTLCPPFCTDD